MKKHMTILLVLALLLCVSAALAATCGDYAYDIRLDGTAVITKYKGEAESLEVPAELDGYAVTVIGSSAF